MCTRHVVPHPRLLRDFNQFNPARLVPLHARHMLAQPIRLRSLGSLCPPGSLLTTVAVQPGRCRRFIGDTHGSRVFVSTMMEHRAHQIAGAFERVRRSNPYLANCNAKFAKSKVPNLLFLHFRNLRKLNFADLAFSIFLIRLMRPAWPGQRCGQLKKVSVALGLFALHVCRHQTLFGCPLRVS